MTEHDPMDAFETRLAALVRSYTEPAARPGDPLETARTAMASATRGGVLGRLWPVGLDRRVAWLLVLAALVVAAAALGIAGGSRPSLVVQAPDGPGRIVFVRDGDLFVAEGDGSGQTRIASGGADDGRLGYLTAAWSPDMAPHRRRPRRRWRLPDAGRRPHDRGRCPGSDRRPGRRLRSLGVLVAGQLGGRDRDLPGRCSEGTPSSRSSRGSGSSSPGWMPPGTERSRCHLNGGRSRARIPRSGSVRTCGRGGRPTVAGSRSGRSSRGSRGWHLVAADGSGTRRIEKLTPDLVQRRRTSTGHPMGAVSRSRAA